jgi:hypothetical protein
VGSGLGDGRLLGVSRGLEAPEGAEDGDRVDTLLTASLLLSSRGRAWARPSCVGCKAAWGQLLVTVVLHHLLGHLSQHTLGQRRRGGLGD